MLERRRFGGIALEVKGNGGTFASIYKVLYLSNQHVTDSPDVSSLGPSQPSLLDNDTTSHAR